MDITTALSLTPAPGANSSTAVAPAANPSTEQYVNGQPAAALNVGETLASDKTQTAFNDALLGIINGLLLGQGKEPKPQAVAGISTPEEEDKQGEKSSTSSPDVISTPQQMLDALLMASQQPVKPVTMNNDPARSGDALLMNHRSNSGVAAAATAQINGALPAALPVADAGMQASAIVTRGMQSITPVPLSTTLAEGLTAISTAVSGQNAEVISNDKVAAAPLPSQALKLEGGENRWAQQLHSALGERLQVQVKNQIQHATIRLDPPDMGKIDISMQIENGRMQVHINASQGEVYRALQQVSNDLRQSLTEQNFVQVNVQISSQSGQQHDGKEQAFYEAQQSVLAGAEIDSEAHQADRREDESVLLTV